MIYTIYGITIYSDECNEHIIQFIIIRNVICAVSEMVEIVDILVTFKALSYHQRRK